MEDETEDMRYFRVAVKSDCDRFNQVVDFVDIYHGNNHFQISVERSSNRLILRSVNFTRTQLLIQPQASNTIVLDAK